VDDAVATNARREASSRAEWVSQAGREGSCRLWALATTSVEGEWLVGTRRRLRDESGSRAKGWAAAGVEGEGGPL
jgi:hypothetical protein